MTSPPITGADLMDDQGLSAALAIRARDSLKAALAPFKAMHSRAEAEKVLADLESFVARSEGRSPPHGDVREEVARWRPIEGAPKDGTPILAFCVHNNHQYAKGADKERWTEIVLTRWIEHNGGGWTWHGLCGVLKAWQPIPAPPVPSEETK